jgi:hypothetical protein
VKQPRGVIVLELNEVSPVVLERLMASGKCPNFQRLQNTHRQFRTYPRDHDSRFEPWIQWVTVHTGRSQSELHISKLSEATAFDQLWDELEDDGIPCGVVSAINSRCGRIRKGFHIPDPWSATDDVYPENLAPIYRFVRNKARSHDASLEGADSKAAFVRDSLRQGVPSRALRRLGEDYLRSRLDRRCRWRLVVDYGRYLLELGLALRERFATPYLSVYLTAVAHYQHRYWTRHDAEFWRPQAPRLFAQENPVDSTDLRPGDDPVAYGLLNYDAMLGEVLERCPESELVILSAISQAPFNGDERGGGFYLYRPYDHNAFFRKLGVNFERIVPLIASSMMMFFASGAQCEDAMEVLGGVSVDGEPLFLCHRECGERLFVEVRYALPGRPGMMIQVGRDAAPLVFHDWLQLTTFKTGEHEAEGFAFVPRDYEPAVDLLGDGRWPLENIYPLLASMVRETVATAGTSAANRVDRGARGPRPS